jgi:hypothetical protein
MHIIWVVERRTPVPVTGVAYDEIFLNGRGFAELRACRAVKVEANHPRARTV